MIKAWWNELPERERKFLTFAGITSGCLLAYLFVWAPFTSSISQLQKEVNNKRQLVTWIQKQAQQIQTLKANSPKTQLPPGKSLTSLMEKNLGQGNIAKWPAKLAQMNGNQVSVEFNEVPFTHLALWLSYLDKRQGLFIESASLIPLETSGLVKAKLVIQN